MKVLVTRREEPNIKREIVGGRILLIAPTFNRPPRAQPTDMIVPNTDRCKRPRRWVNHPPPTAIQPKEQRQYH
jgi:hypothetical protein